MPSARGFSGSRRSSGAAAGTARRRCRWSSPAESWHGSSPASHPASISPPQWGGPMEASPVPASCISPSGHLWWRPACPSGRGRRSPPGLAAASRQCNWCSPTPVAHGATGRSIPTLLPTPWRCSTATSPRPWRPTSRAAPATQGKTLSRSPCSAFSRPLGVSHRSVDRSGPMPGPMPTGRCITTSATRASSSRCRPPGASCMRGGRSYCVTEYHKKSCQSGLVSARIDWVRLQSLANSEL